MNEYRVSADIFGHCVVSQVLKRMFSGTVVAFSEEEKARKSAEHFLALCQSVIPTGKTYGVVSVVERATGRLVLGQPIYRENACPDRDRLISELVCHLTSRLGENVDLSWAQQRAWVIKRALIQEGLLD